MIRKETDNGMIVQFNSVKTSSLGFNKAFLERLYYLSKWLLARYIVDDDYYNVTFDQNYTKEQSAMGKKFITIRLTFDKDEE